MLSSYILIFIVVVVCIGKSIIFCCILPLIFLITLSIKDLNYSKAILYDILFYVLLLIIITFILVGISYDNNQTIINTTTIKEEFIKLEPKFESNLKNLINIYQTPVQDKSWLISAENANVSCLEEEEDKSDISFGNLYFKDHLCLYSFSFYFSFFQQKQKYIYYILKII